MTLRELTFPWLCGCLVAAAGCSAASTEPSPGTTAQPLTACGITELATRRAPERVEGDARACFVAFGPDARAKLAKDPGDFGLMGPELVSERDGVRVYQGRGTQPGAHLYSAAKDVGGYACIVNGFDSAEAAARGVAVCSLVEGGRS